jgi:hypothetical protein
MNLIAAIQALRAGKELANAAAWKNRQNAINAVVGLLVLAASVANAYGLEIRLTDDLAAGIATGVWAVVNLYLTTATTSKIGLPAKAEPAGLDGESGGSAPGV